MIQIRRFSLFFLVLIIGTTPLAADNFNLILQPLYWYTTEVADWALVVETSNPADQKTTFKTTAFDWTPGLRVGCSYMLDQDCWETQFTYTTYHSHSSDSAKGGAGFVQPAFFGFKITDIGTFESGSIKMNINYQMLDWDLSRRFCVSNAIQMRPYIGLKGGWINQSIHTEWHKTLDFIIFTTPLTAKENLKNDFRGIGPKLGIDTTWMIRQSDACAFFLSGDFACAYMWGNWSIKDRYRDTINQTVDIIVNNRNFGAWMVQAFLGLGWTSTRYSVRIGYEVQDWFNQYQIFDNSTGGQSNDLLIQGLTADFRIAF